MSAPDYSAVAALVRRIHEDGCMSSSDMPNAIDDMGEKWGGANTEIDALHTLLVAMLEANLYTDTDWLKAAYLAEHLAILDVEMRSKLRPGARVNYWKRDAQPRGELVDSVVKEREFDNVILEDGTEWPSDRWHKLDVG